MIEAGVNPCNALFHGDPSAVGNVLTNDSGSGTKTVVGAQAGTTLAPLRPHRDRLTGVYGTLTLSTNGAWTYTLNTAISNQRARKEPARHRRLHLHDEGQHWRHVYYHAHHQYYRHNDKPVIEASSETTGTIGSGDLAGINEASPRVPFAPAHRLLAIQQPAANTLPSANNPRQSRKRPCQQSTPRSATGYSRSPSSETTSTTTTSITNNAINEAFIHLAPQPMRTICRTAAARLSTSWRSTPPITRSIPACGNQPRSRAVLALQPLQQSQHASMIDKLLGASDSAPTPRPFPPSTTH